MVDSNNSGVTVVVHSSSTNTSSLLFGLVRHGGNTFGFAGFFVGDGNIGKLLSIAMSAQPRNSSCGPQPTAPESKKKKKAFHI